MARKKSYTREILAPRPMKFRPQRVKFRRRYANSIVSTWTRRAALLLRAVLVVAALAFGIFKTREFWASSSWVRVVAVQTSGDVTPEMTASLGLNPGLNIVTMKPSEIEEKTLASHLEFERFVVRRTFRRSLTVDGTYRSSVASLENSSGPKYLSAEGVVFSLPAGVRTDREPVWTGDMSGVDLRRAAAALEALKKNSPEFYKRVKFLKTDRIQPLRLILDSDVVVIWGDFEAFSASARASRIMDVLTRYEPKKAYASLRFIADDRVVMDAQWREK